MMMRLKFHAFTLAAFLLGNGHYHGSCAFVIEKMNILGASGSIVHTELLMSSSGGPGWKNDNFLDSLGGDAGDQEDAEEAYQEFRESRQAFEKRQEERMNTDAGRLFLQQQQQQQQRDAFQEEADEEAMFMGGGNLGGNPGRQPSRFRKMMEQSKRMAAARSQPFDGPPGLEQRFAVPLDDDEAE